MNMEYLVVAILSEMSSIREDLIVDSKKGGAHYKYYKGKLEGLRFALERTQDKEFEVDVLEKMYRHTLREYGHLLDIETWTSFKDVIARSTEICEGSA